MKAYILKVEVGDLQTTFRLTDKGRLLAQLSQYEGIAEVRTNVKEIKGYEVS